MTPDQEFRRRMVSWLFFVFGVLFVLGIIGLFVAECYNNFFLSSYVRKATAEPATWTSEGCKISIQIDEQQVWFTPDLMQFCTNFEKPQEVIVTVRKGRILDDYGVDSVSIEDHK